jgi:hypothetical protein
MIIRVQSRIQLQTDLGAVRSILSFVVEDLFSVPSRHSPGVPCSSASASASARDQEAVADERSSTFLPAPPETGNVQSDMYLFTRATHIHTVLQPTVLTDQRT